VIPENVVFSLPYVSTMIRKALYASSMTLGKTAREFDLALHKYSPASEFPAPVQSLQFDLLPCPALFLRLTLLGYPGCGPPTNVSTSAARADM